MSNDAHHALRGTAIAASLKNATVTPPRATHIKHVRAGTQATSTTTASSKIALGASTSDSEAPKSAPARQAEKSTSGGQSTIRTAWPAPPPATSGASRKLAARSAPAGSSPAKKRSVNGWPAGAAGAMRTRSAAQCSGSAARLAAASTRYTEIVGISAAIGAIRKANSLASRSRAFAKRASSTRKCSAAESSLASSSGLRTTKGAKRSTREVRRVLP